MSSLYVLLAKLAVESFISEGKIISVPKDLPQEFFERKSGIFVTIEKENDFQGTSRDKERRQRILRGVPCDEERKRRVLRGCIGTYLPTKKNIAQEIISNAIAAATEDYRFGQIQKEELPYLKYTVYILGEPELVKDASKLDPKRYGIIVRTVPIASPQKTNVFFNGHVSRKSGLLLPGLEDINTPERQVAVAAQKAGIDLKTEPIIIYRFTTEKYQ